TRKGVANPGEPRRIERERRQFARLMRQCGRPLGLPATLGKRNLLAAVPWRMARSLAAGMGKLHRHGYSGMFAHRCDDRPQCGFVGVVPQAETSRRDAADRLYMG